ncbi:MAG: sigma-70 family RNA polymerase sigma factor [Roseiflexaceae bacterium]
MKPDTAADQDDQLILACRRGDADAWEQLLDRYERLVLAIPRSYGLSADDAADIAQLTFTSLIQHLDRLQADTRLAAWLVTVARRTTWRTIERRRSESAFEPYELDSRLPWLVGQPDQQIERWELTEWLHGGLAHLGERCRDLILALYFAPDEPSYAEISERLGVPLGSIGPNRARCLAQLRQALERTH